MINNNRPYLSKACAALINIGAVFATVLLLQGCMSNGQSEYPAELQQIIAQRQQVQTQPVSVASILAAARQQSGQSLEVLQAQSTVTLHYQQGQLLPDAGELSKLKMMAKHYPMLAVKVGPLNIGSTFTSVAWAKKRVDRLLGELASPYAEPLLEYRPDLGKGQIIVSFESGGNDE